MSNKNKTQLDDVRTERQQEIVDKWIANNGRGTALAVTGFGKTRTLLMGAEACVNSKNAVTQRDVTVIVPTNYLKKEWEEALQHYNFPSKVYTIQTLIRRYNAGKKLRTSILLPDEIHRYTSDQFGTLFNIVNYDFIFGASATIDTEDEKYAIVNDKCPIIDKVTLDEAKSNNWVSDFTIYNLAIELSDEEQILYNKMTNKFSKYFGTFNWDFDLAMQCFSNDDACKRVASFLGWDPQAVKIHAVQLFRVIQDRKFFLYNLDSKIKVAKEIIDRFPDRIFITFSESTEFAERLAEEIGDEAVAYHSNLTTLVVDDKKKVVAKAVKVDNRTKYKDKSGNLYTWDQIKSAYPNKKLSLLGNKRRKDLAIKRFKDGRTKIRAVSTAKALDEGANFPSLSASIVTSGSSKTRQSIQRLGRMIRYQEGKSAFQVELYAKGTQDEKWLIRRQEESINIQWITSINQIKA